MKYRREISVGIAIVVAIGIFIFGVRFFQDLPVFGGTYSLHTTFPTAEGLLSGSPVHVRGVRVGTVRRVTINPDGRSVDVEFHVHHDVTVPEGSVASVSGMAMLGNVILDVELGPPSNPRVPRDGHIAGTPGAGLESVLDRAPELAARADSAFISLQATLAKIDRIVLDQSDLLAQTMMSLRNTSERVNLLIAGQSTAIETSLGNMAALTTDLRAITDGNVDSLRLALRNANQIATRADSSLLYLQHTIARADSLLHLVESGDGTLGLLARDPSLYHNIDSTMASLNRLLISFERNPGRFLREVTLIDLF
jgi:phospholipid/cholesterol/gamma-HCH transport system substrate-binding protein